MQSGYMRPAAGVLGGLNDQELVSELNDATARTEDPRAAHRDRVAADAQAKAIKTELAARGVRVARQQAAANAEQAFAEPVPYFAAPARNVEAERQDDVQNAADADERTVMVEDSWTNPNGETVVAHNAGLLVLPPGSKVERGQEIAVLV